MHASSASSPLIVASHSGTGERLARIRPGLGSLSITKLIGTHDESRRLWHTIICLNTLSLILLPSLNPCISRLRTVIRLSLPSAVAQWVSSNLQVHPDRESNQIEGSSSQGGGENSPFNPSLSSNPVLIFNFPGTTQDSDVLVRGASVPYQIQAFAAIAYQAGHPYFAPKERRYLPQSGRPMVDLDGENRHLYSQRNPRHTRGFVCQ